MRKIQLITKYTTKEEKKNKDEKKVKEINFYKQSSQTTEMVGMGSAVSIYVLSDPTEIGDNM